MNAVPLSIALTAGGLSVVNPCGFPLLPAFLSFYLGADEERLPSAPTRIAQGLIVGALVAVGFFGVFAAVGLPLSFGIGAIADAVPWLGLATGGVLALAGLLATAGRAPRLPVRVRLRLRQERRLGAMVIFGVGYGAASLGCTLPIFLALVGASLGADKLAVFGAYALGMAVVLTALSVGVACAREGLARVPRSLAPYVGRLAGMLLVVAGGYLVYYWARVRFGNDLTLADDPLVGFAARYSAELEGFAGRHGAPLIASSGAIVAIAIASTVLRRLRRGEVASGELARR